MLSVKWKGYVWACGGVLLACVVALSETVVAMALVLSTPRAFPISSSNNSVCSRKSSSAEET